MKPRTSQITYTYIYSTGMNWYLVSWVYNFKSWEIERGWEYFNLFPSAALTNEGKVLRITKWPTSCKFRFNGLSGQQARGYHLGALTWKSWKSYAEMLYFLYSQPSLQCIKIILQGSAYHLKLSVKEGNNLDTECTCSSAHAARILSTCIVVFL